MNDKRLTHDGYRIEGLAVQELIEKILLQDHADRFVYRPATDQELFETTFANGLQHLLRRIFGVDPIDFQPRRHDIGDIAVADVEDTFDQLLLRLFQQAPPPGFRRPAV